MISVLCPSRGRPDSLADMAATALTAATGPVEIVVRLDDDDPADYPEILGVTYLTGPRALLSACWNECAAHAAGPIFMHAGDDIRFRTPGWDRAVTAAFPPDRIALVHGRDGIHDDRLGTHSFVHRAWVDAVGYFVPPLFSSDFNDTWLNDVADRIGRRIYLPDLLTEHLHPSVGKAEWDLTHRERLERHALDDVEGIYAETAHLRERDAEALRAVIAVPA